MIPQGAIAVFEAPRAPRAADAARPEPPAPQPTAGRTARGDWDIDESPFEHLVKPGDSGVGERPAWDGPSAGFSAVRPPGAVDHIDYEYGEDTDGFDDESWFRAPMAPGRPGPPRAPDPPRAPVTQMLPASSRTPPVDLVREAPPVPANGRGAHAARRRPTKALVPARPVDVPRPAEREATRTPKAARPVHKERDH